MDITQDRVTELQCCPSFCPTLSQTQVIHAGSHWDVLQGSANTDIWDLFPLQGCWWPALFLVPSLTSKRNVALKGQFCGTVIAELEGCPEGRTAEAALTPSMALSSAVMLKIGSDGVWLIWGRYKSGKSVLHQSEERNLKLSHHLRKLTGESRMKFSRDVCRILYLGLTI